MFPVCVNDELVYNVSEILTPNLAYKCHVPEFPFAESSVNGVFMF